MNISWRKDQLSFWIHVLKLLQFYLVFLTPGKYNYLIKEMKVFTDISKLNIFLSFLVKADNSKDCLRNGCD